MNNINISNINEESFVDEQVLESKIDLKNRKIYIVTKGGCLDDGSYLDKIEILIEDWDSLKINQTGNNYKKELDINNAEFISSILKFKYDNNDLVLHDIGDHCWITWEFLKPTIKIYGLQLHSKNLIIGS